MSKKEEERREALFAEYRTLNEAIRSRGREHLLATSIMIPSSLLVVIFAITNREQLGESVHLGHQPVAAFIPLIALALVLIPYVLYLTTKELDDLCFERIKEIEAYLGIKGHHWIYEKATRYWLFRLRRDYLWHIFFLMWVAAYIFTAYWLFT